MDNPNDTAGKMNLPRALELLNALIELLLDVGFTAEELVEDFCFPQESVDEEVSAMEDDGDG